MYGYKVINSKKLSNAELKRLRHNFPVATYKQGDLTFYIICGDVDAMFN